MELLIYFSLNDSGTLVTEKTNGLYMRADNREREAAAPTESAVIQNATVSFMTDRKCHGVEHSELTAS